nr:NAD(P)-dependent oxidoreductase [uncultured Blautia sp.]
MNRQMKMIAYAVEPEEIPIFEKYYRNYNIDLKLVGEKPNPANIALANGYDCINVLSDTYITDEMWDGFHVCGVRIAVTRCIGMEHMNQAYAHKLGIQIFNITYSPASVADYAIMMMLMLLRNVKPILQRYLGQDYTMSGIRGRELPNMTVGVIGAGHIGQTVVKHLSGFGCRVLYWNRHPKDELEGFAEYCDLPTLLAQSDIVSLHIASNKETYHFMNPDRITSMKQGALLINTARGPIVDSAALIEALESGHLSGAGLDVIDGDRNIYYRDHKNEMIIHHEMAILNSMPNVLMMPHAAYFTNQALEDMVHNSLIVTSQCFKDMKEQQ